jgi:hypothetical protein
MISNKIFLIIQIYFNVYASILKNEDKNIHYDVFSHYKSNKLIDEHKFIAFQRVNR